MLGLNNSIISSTPTIKLLGTYTSDFSSDADSWEPWDEQGTVTLTGAQNRPGGSSDANWLKVAYDTDQTAGTLTGIKLLNITTGWTRNISDYFKVSFKIWLHNESGEDWGGTDDVSVSFRGGFETGVGESIGGATAGPMLVGQDQEVSVFAYSDGTIGSASYNDIGLYFILPGDLPLEDAEFYVKDIVVEFYGNS